MFKSLKKKDGLPKKKKKHGMRVRGDGIYTQEFKKGGEKTEK